MDGEKSGERDCEGNARGGVVRKKEKEMETGEVGFLFLLHGMGGGRGRKNKDENGNALAAQAGVEVVGWRETVGLVQKDMRRDVLAGWRRNGAYWLPQNV